MLVCLKHVRTFEKGFIRVRFNFSTKSIYRAGQQLADIDQKTSHSEAWKSLANPAVLAYMIWSAVPE